MFCQQTRHILDDQVFDVIWLCGDQFLNVYICNSLIFKKISFYAQKEYFF
jgi:hypothetical protein